MGLAFLFFKFLLLQCLTPNLPHSRSHAVLGSLASLPTAGLLPLLVGPIKSHCLTRRKTKRASEEVIPPKQQWVTEQAPACTRGQGARQGSRTAKPGGKLRLEMIVKFLEVTWAEVVMFPASTDRGPHLWTIQILCLTNSLLLKRPRALLHPSFSLLPGHFDWSLHWSLRCVIDCGEAFCFFVQGGML